MTIQEINDFLDKIDVRKVVFTLLKQLFYKEEEILIDIRCPECNRKQYEVDLNKNSTQEFLCFHRSCRLRKERIITRIEIKDGIVEKKTKPMIIK